MPEIILTPTRTLGDYKAQLADIRFQKETAGIVLDGGMVVRTDRESQALVTGAWSASQLNPDIVLDWKGANGWVTLNATQIAQIAAVVTSHVQACFTWEKELAEALDDATDPSTVDLTVGWPE
jgi:hypothetical protein